MKTKLVFSLLLFLLLLASSTKVANAKNFSDNFNKGNLNRWYLGYSLPFPSVYGNWRVENGQLIQDNGYDGTFALIKNSKSSTQTVEVDVKVLPPSGSTGFLIWFKDPRNFVSVGLSNGNLGANETIEGAETVYNEPVSYNVNENRFARLKVEANSLIGEIAVYLDGVHIFSFSTNTDDKSGQTGVITGNAGGIFDNFNLH